MVPKGLYIFPVHFLLSLSQWRSEHPHIGLGIHFVELNITTVVTIFEHNRHKEYIKNILYYFKLHIKHRVIIIIVIKAILSNMFIQPPVTTKNEV